MPLDMVNRPAQEASLVNDPLRVLKAGSWLDVKAHLDASLVNDPLRVLKGCCCPTSTLICSSASLVNDPLRVLKAFLCFRNALLIVGFIG